MDLEIEQLLELESIKKNFVNEAIDKISYIARNPFSEGDFLLTNNETMAKIWAKYDESRQGI